MRDAIVWRRTLSMSDINVLQSALASYQLYDQGEPANRRAAVHAVASGFSGSRFEQVSFDDDALCELMDKVDDFEVRAHEAATPMRLTQPKVNTLLAALWFSASDMGLEKQPTLARTGSASDMRLFLSILDQAGMREAMLTDNAFAGVDLALYRTEC